MRRLVVLIGVMVLLVAGGGLAEAAFTTHESNPQTFSAAGGPEPAELVAQSRTNDGGASGSQIQFGLRLTNDGGERINLKDVTARYWFTADGSSGEPVPACYYASFGCNQIDQTVTDLPDLLDGADHYSEVAFQNGKLDPGESAQLDQLALRDPAGATYRQDNDHSFLDNESFTDNPNVTVYIDGALAWGTEPAPVDKVESVAVQYSNLDSDPHDNAIKPGLKVIDTGTVDIDLRRLTLRYWFTAEGATSAQGFCDYAALGCAKVSLRSAAVRPARPGADTYLEVGFTVGTLEAATGTGPMQLRLHPSDFAPFDETDDYSHDTNTSFATTTTVTAYLDGKLVWGTEP